jgi:hypothetical protein
MIALSLMAVICIVVFQGNTEQLIPLYAIGVFIPFSCALLGLVISTLKTSRMIVPALALLLTVTVVVTLVITKWMIIWPIVIFVPLIVYGCLRIKRHYNLVEQTLSATTEFPQYQGQIMIIPISGIYETTQKALSIAQLQKCTAIYALYVGQSKKEIENMENEWAKFSPDIRLITFVSNNQHVLKPILRAIQKLHTLAAKQQYHVIVAIPQLVTTKKHHALLHNHHAFMLKQALLDYPDISVLTIPFRAVH